MQTAEYEQMVAIYGTMVVKAKDPDEARGKIRGILERKKLMIPLRLEEAEFIWGDFERLDDAIPRCLRCGSIMERDEDLELFSCPNCGAVIPDEEVS